MTSDSEFVAFINHAIQLAPDFTTYPNIWAILLILLETQDVNMSYVQVMHDYNNQCYNTRTEEYIVALEKAAEQLKNNMYNNTLDGVSAYVQQPVCDPLVQSTDQHDANAENCTQLSYAASISCIFDLYCTSLVFSISFVSVQSNQLTTNIPNNLPNSTEIGQQDDYDYQDNSKEYLYQVDGTTDIHTPTDHSADDEDTEPDNNSCKRQRKTYAPADTIRKDLTKQRQAHLLKNQQEKERTKAQALENRDKTDKNNKNRTHRSTAQPEDNRDNIDGTNNPRT